VRTDNSAYNSFPHSAPGFSPRVRRQSGSCSLPAIVSLFSGAGGLDWGFQKEGFEISVAFDSAPAAIRTHRRNFPGTTAITCDLDDIGPSGVLEHVLGAVPAGSRIGVIGGPPCQGFSRANVSRSKDDPRNKLPNLYLRIVRKLQKRYRIEFIVFENVLGMRDTKHRKAYEALVRGLRKLDLHLSEQELCATDFGVPQTRKRIVLMAMAQKRTIPNLRPRRRTGPRSVRDVIGSLPAPMFFARDLSPDQIPLHPNHWTMNPKSRRFQKRHAQQEGRSFKRLAWSKPSPTIAFGHREIHVHPGGKRRLSIYEAMLLQGFPNNFVIEGNLSEQVEQVSNAVPPPLARSVASAFRRAYIKRRR
jgi:DNA (cytosine-5)-methyltransferase 1